MTVSNEENLKEWIADMAMILSKNEDPSSKHYTYFLQEPELALSLVAIIAALDERQLDDERAYYSACIFALDICVAQLQVVVESGSKLAARTLSQLMSALASAINKKDHSLSFWLPILNAFYEVHIELSPVLREAYLNLANEEEDLTPEEEVSHLNSIRDLILELSDLSVFDITENFFAQSYAMPADFFADLLVDLYSIEEGQDIALLTLMHPKQDVRDVVVATFEQLIDTVTLSSVSLSRLKTIRDWYPKSYHAQFNTWIKIQRKKGVVFNQEAASPTMRIKASEVDGSGAQGIFIHLKKNRKNRLCGLLFKQGIGIKDAWITPVITIKDIDRYYDEAFDDSVMLREVDKTYLQLIASHFLAVTLEQGSMPDLHFLEMQEELGLHWTPKKIDIDYLVEKLAVQILPFTEESLQASFKRTKTWPKYKRFTESWYVENANIDKLVNRSSSYIDGVKVCRFKDAMQSVFSEEFELHRDKWLFHFLWIALWLQSKVRKNEKIWQDSFLIAYSIYNGMRLSDIPIMHEICHQSVINSIETMQERRTHLNQQ